MTKIVKNLGASLKMSVIQADTLLRSVCFNKVNMRQVTSVVNCTDEILTLSSLANFRSSLSRFTFVLF